MEIAEHHVFFTAREGTSLIEAMEQLDPWLLRNDIKPIGVDHTITQAGRLEVQLTFSTRRDASLFERALCDAGEVA